MLQSNCAACVFDGSSRYVVVGVERRVDSCTKFAVVLLRSSFVGLLGNNATIHSCDQNPAQQKIIFARPSKRSLLALLFPDVSL